MESTRYVIMHLANDAPLPEPYSHPRQINSTMYQTKNKVRYLTNKDNTVLYFDTFEKALRVAKEFKENPRSHRKMMTDDLVEYWRNQRLTIVKRTITLEIMGEV